MLHQMRKSFIGFHRNSSNQNQNTEQKKEKKRNQRHLYTDRQAITLAIGDGVGQQLDFKISYRVKKAGAVRAGVRWRGGWRGGGARALAPSFGSKATRRGYRPSNKWATLQISAGGGLGGRARPAGRMQRSSLNTVNRSSARAEWHGLAGHPLESV